MKKLLLIFIAIISFVDGRAQLFPTLGQQRVGISTAEFLKIGVGSRATAMGETFIAISNDVTALYWNPAGLAQFDKDEIIFSHNADLSTSLSSPGNKIVLFLLRKSKCPDQLVAIIGSLQAAASRIGRPNPSPAVKVQKLLILGCV